MKHPTVVAALIILMLVAACSGSQLAGDAKSVIGDCQPGITLQAEEGCTIVNTVANDTFWVNQDGSGCYSVKTDGVVYTSTTKCAYPALSEDAISVAKNDAGGWTVLSIP